MPAKLMMGMVGISPFIVTRSPSPTLRVEWASTTRSLICAQLICLVAYMATFRLNVNK